MLYYRDCTTLYQALRKSYSAVMNSDPFDTLADLLSSLHADKYALARSFIISTNIQPREVGSHTNSPFVTLFVSLDCWVSQ